MDRNKLKFVTSSITERYNFFKLTKNCLILVLLTITAIISIFGMVSWQITMILLGTIGLFDTVVSYLVYKDAKKNKKKVDDFISEWDKLEEGNNRIEDIKKLCAKLDMVADNITTQSLLEALDYNNEKFQEIYLSILSTKKEDIVKVRDKLKNSEEDLESGKEGLNNLSDIIKNIEKEQNLLEKEHEKVKIDIKENVYR